MAILDLIYPIISTEDMKNFLPRLRTLIRRIFGKNARTAWISHPIFSFTEPCRLHHPESPLRIAAIEEELKQQQIWPHLQTIEAEEIKDSRLALVHPRKYLRFLESHQPQNGKIYRLDDDTIMTDHSLKAARLAAGAVVQAVDMVMKKKAYHAFCAIRPPGHHAHADRAGGFCLLNNAAVGAMHAIAKYRLKRIAIIDFDVHFGDGTADIFKDDPRVLFLNSFETDLFPFPKEDVLTENSANLVHLPLAQGTGSQAFRTLIRQKWLPRLAKFKPELVVISAGFDGHRLDETGHLHLHETDFAWLTHKIIQTAPGCNGRIVSLLEGGYTLESLKKSAAAHLQVLVGLPKSDAAKHYEQYLKHDYTQTKPPFYPNHLKI